MREGIVIGGVRSIGGEIVIYNRIQFKAVPFTYNLEMLHRITLVKGDSGTGKTYLFGLLWDLKDSGLYDRLELFNRRTKDFHRLLYECKDRCIVIDNADILLDWQDKQFINFEKSNQYLIFGRSCSGLALSSKSFMLLSEDNFSVTLVRENSV